MEKSSLRLPEILEKLAGGVQVKVIPTQISGNMNLYDFSDTVRDIANRLGISLRSSGIQEDYEERRRGSSDWRRYHVEFDSPDDAIRFATYVNEGKSSELNMVGLPDVPIAYHRIRVIERLE
ncbi:hypothetical protein HYW20_03225 [Candidatus Woesearchaeota archaeon]|nr:hypothetical protein [Candidatus Woesearchaeota archaeon]